jgi:uncharacterized protein (TIGR03435 family)
MDTFPGLPLLLAVFWKSGVVLGDALCLCRLLRKRSADVRRVVLSTAIISILVVATAMPVLPQWTAVMPRWFALRQPAVLAVSNDSRTSTTIDDRAEPLTATQNGTLRHTPLRLIDVSQWLIFAIWSIGTTALMIRFAMSLRRLHRLRVVSEPLSDAGILADLVAHGSRVQLRRNETFPSPVTWGLFRSVILVPEEFESLPSEPREAVIRHELAHIEAHDFLMRCLTELACSLLWFQPLAWIVRRRLHEEQEIACDDRVLADGGTPSVYAQLLLEWSARREPVVSIAAGVAHRSSLKRRLYSLLDSNLRRECMTNAQIAGAIFLNVAVALPLAAVHFTQPAFVPQAQTASPGPKFEAASIRPCRPGDGSGRGGTGDMGANRGINPNLPEGVGGYFRATPGRLDVTCGSLLTMVGVAYVENGNSLLNNPGALAREPEHIKGIPKWALDARYTIHAETQDPAATGPIDPLSGNVLRPAASLLYGPMLQRLLEDRFQLKLHRVTEESPMYALTVARGGLKIQPMKEGDCIPGGPPRWLDGGKPPCGWVGWSVHGPNRLLLAGGITLQRFARELGVLTLDRNVIDRTGVTGSFVFRLEYTPDENNRCLGPPELCQVDSTSVIPPAGTIFSALQQIGLRLENIKGPREYIMIDHVEPPSEN